MLGCKGLTLNTHFWLLLVKQGLVRNWQRGKSTKEKATMASTEKVTTTCILVQPFFPKVSDQHLISPKCSIILNNDTNNFSDKHSWDKIQCKGEPTLNEDLLNGSP